MSGYLNERESTGATGGGKAARSASRSASAHAARSAAAAAPATCGGGSFSQGAAGRAVRSTAALDSAAAETVVMTNTAGAASATGHGGTSQQQSATGAGGTFQQKCNDKFVNIMLANKPGSFVEIEIFEGDTVGRLTKRACAEYPRWVSDYTKLSLRLIPAARAPMVERDHRSASDLLSGKALFSGELLSDAGVGPSSYLLALIISARKPPLAQAPVLSPLSLQQVAQIALASAQHWLTVAFQSVAGSFHASTVLRRNRRVLEEGGSVPHRTLDLGAANEVEGAALKED